MVSCGGGRAAWSWYTGQTPGQLQDLAQQNADRIIAISSYAGCGDLCLSFILVDNSLPSLDSPSPITSRVGQLLRAGGINGVQGLYLKQVGGPVLANLQESFVYEPAGSIKVLAHRYAMTQAHNGAATLARFKTWMTEKGEYQAEGFDFAQLGDTDMPAIITQAAPAATPAQKVDYLSRMNLAYKAGSYTIWEDSCSHIAEYYSISGWV